MRSGLVLGGLAAAAGIGTLVWWKTAHAAQDRNFQLINGKRYAINARLTGPGWDASLFPGFCEFSNPVITGQVGNATEVQFMANWCATNMVWVVPQNIAISEA